MDLGRPFMGVVECVTECDGQGGRVKKMGNVQTLFMGGRIAIFPQDENSGKKFGTSNPSRDRFHPNSSYQHTYTESVRS
jgi:hypothetical protein